MWMRLYSFLALACSCLVGATNSSLDGLYALVERRIPQHTNSFNFTLVEGGADVFEVTNTDSGILVKCTTVSACSRGLYEYLTRYGGVDIWWTGSRLDQLSSTLPTINGSINGGAIVPYRYHFNTVTFGYTTAFWNFTQWELELDWLALRGVNLPLAWVGYEYMLMDMFQGVGLSETDVIAFLSGPAFHPWNRLGNIRSSWGGDIPTKWIDDQFTLGKQIVARMVELGMTPVLPAFSGFVPDTLASLYPDASIVQESTWEGFDASVSAVHFLEPTDDLFQTLQKSFLAKQKAVYGNVSHIYALDQYNENDPHSGDLDYLSDISKYTLESLLVVDPDAVWVMQGWLFYTSESWWTEARVKAYLGGVEDDDRMIILDLYSEAKPQWERTESYHGKQWIWCELHDYGGNMGIEGNLPELVKGPLEALEKASSMTGMGLTMEGQEGNEIVYNILLDQAWSSTSVNISSYVDNWVARRYLVDSLPDAAQKAWDILSTTVYRNTNADTQATIKSILELAPALSGIVNVTGTHPTMIPYDTDTTIVPALTLLYQAAIDNPALLDVPEFTYDLVNVARQLLANRFIDAYEGLVATFWSNSPGTAVNDSGAPLLEILTDLDALLYTNENFLLSNWIASARNLSDSENAYEAYLEYNARNQITLWGPNGEINDYASKQWAGLVGTYYYARWKAFIKYLVGRVNRHQYGASEVKTIAINLGKEWDLEQWGKREGEEWGTKGDVMTEVGNAIDKYITRWQTDMPKRLASSASLNMEMSLWGRQILLLSTFWVVLVSV